MPSVRAGAVASADLQRNDTMMAAAPNSKAGGRFDTSSPAFWSKVWFCAAIGYLAGMAVAAGGFRGSAGM